MLLSSTMQSAPVRPRTFLAQRPLFGVLPVLLAVVFAWPVVEASAHGPEGHKNLRVIAAEDHEALERGMKAMAKGLGVPCTACHIKGKFDSDKVQAKAAARKFFAATIGEEDAEIRAAALRDLLQALKIAKPRDEAQIWLVLRSWKKRPADVPPEHHGH